MQLAQRRPDEPPAYNPNQPANRVEVIREYTNDILQVLGKEQEAQILREEMREELVRQVVDPNDQYPVLRSTNPAGACPAIASLTPLATCVAATSPAVGAAIWGVICTRGCDQKGCVSGNGS